MESAAAAYSFYPSNIDITDVVRALNAAGFGNENICLFLSPAHPATSKFRNVGLFSTAAHADGQLQKDHETATSANGLVRLGAVVILRSTFLIHSTAFLRPFAEAALPSDLTKLFLNLGFCEADAQRFAVQLARDGSLLYVMSAEFERAKWAMEILRITGASETGALEKTKKAGAAA